MKSIIYQQKRLEPFGKIKIFVNLHTNVWYWEEEKRSPNSVGGGSYCLILNPSKLTLNTKKNSNCKGTLEIAILKTFS